MFIEFRLRLALKGNLQCMRLFPASHANLAPKRIAGIEVPIPGRPGIFSMLAPLFQEFESASGKGKRPAFGAGNHERLKTLYESQPDRKSVV